MTWSETTRASPSLRWRILRNSRLDRRAGHGGDRLADGRELRPDGRRRRSVVETDDGQVARHVQPRRCATETAAAAMSSLLAKIAVGGLLCQQLFGRFQAGAIGEVALLDQPGSIARPAASSPPGSLRSAARSRFDSPRMKPMRRGPWQSGAPSFSGSRGSRRCARSTSRLETAGCDRDYGNAGSDQLRQHDLRLAQRRRQNDSPATLCAILRAAAAPRHGSCGPTCRARLGGRRAGKRRRAARSDRRRSDSCRSGRCVCLARRRGARGSACS